MRRQALWIVAALAFLAWLFRKPIAEWYDQRQVGLAAAADAAIENRYTTYNTQMYTDPVWRPLLRFFKANAYMPAGDSSGSGEPVNYSIQG